MARFNTSGLDQLISDMQRMGQETGPVAEAMVQAAAAEIRDAWRESAEAHGHRDTGAMIDSIGFPRTPQRAGDILFQDVYPQGKDGKGVRNAEKAFILHYGTSRKKGSYWVDDADKNAGPKVQERLEQIWGEWLDSGRVPQITDTGPGTGTGINTVKK